MEVSLHALFLMAVVASKHHFLPRFHVAVAEFDFARPVLLLFFAK
jgi:hypothetical protein